LNPNGRAGIIVPEGIIFQSGTAYKKLRKMLVDHSLYAVVSLPAGVFNPYSGVKTSILMLDKNLAKKTDKILFVKVNNDGFGLGAQRREVKGSDLPMALEIIKRYKQSIVENKEFEFSADEAKFASLVEKIKIAESGDHNLSGDRYKEAIIYSGKWDFVELGEVCEIKTGKKDVNQGNPNGKYPFFTCAKEHTFSDGFSFDTEALLIAGNGDVGSVQYHKGKFEAYQRTYVLFDFKKVTAKYLFFVLEVTLKEIISKQKLGNTMPYIKLGMLKKFKIPLPPLEVQEQIVAELDNYQKIIDGAKQVVENYKPTFKIDPEWEVVELGDVFKLSSGRFLPKKKQKEGKYFVYGGNGISGMHNEYFLDKPTLIIGRVGEYCGAVHITKEKSWATDNALYVTEYIREIDQKFLCYSLLSRNLNQYAKRGGQPSLSQSTLYRVKIYLPDIDIQQEIARLLEKEKKAIEYTKELIALFEQKIKQKITEIWGKEK